MTSTRIPLVLLGLFVVWCLMIGSRNVWTPDEPRELALAASQVGQFTGLPTLGGTPFTEKPPLAYWLSGAAMRELGVSGAAARLPLLLYALISIVSIYLLGRRMGSVATGTVAALVFATAWQVFGVQIWLATDALLLAGVLLSLLGAHVAFGGTAGNRQRWIGCVWFHAGLLLALFAKNFAGWLVPISALLTFLYFERRLRQLLSLAFLLPGLASLVLLLAWMRSVADGPGGAANLHALFWDNLAGRFASYGNSSDAIRVLGHRNWPGKYLVELPVYLLPWTVIAVGAVVRLWRDPAARAATAVSWRFALCACVPGLVVLSFASTARGTYAATILAGVALFIAVLATYPCVASARMDTVRKAIHWNAWLILLLDGGLLAALCVVQLIRGMGGFATLLVALAAVAGMLWICVRCIRDSATFAPTRVAPEVLIVRLAGAHVASLIGMAALFIPLQNQWQDLGRIAQLIEQTAGGRPLILWRPDETTLAMSDLYLRKPVCVIPIDAEDQAQRSGHLTRCLKISPDAAVISLENCHDAECGFAHALLSDVDPMQRRTLASSDAALAAAGVETAAGIVRPGGRAYMVGIRSP